MRLFFGIALHSEARRAAADYLLAARGLWPGRYVKPATLHMTVCYVGAVEDVALRQVMDVGAAAAALLPRTPLTLGGVGHFGRADRAILYLDALGGQAYAPLAQALRSSLGQAGLPYDPKPFAPHITIARDARLSAHAPPAPRPVSWTPDGLILFHSHRAEGMLTYTPIAQWR